MDDYGFVHLRWKKSTRCENGSCVEIAMIGSGAAIRDSKQLNGPVLPAGNDWAAFVVEIKTGAFDLPS